MSSSPRDVLRFRGGEPEKGLVRADCEVRRILLEPGAQATVLFTEPAPEVGIDLGENSRLRQVLLFASSPQARESKMLVRQARDSRFGSHVFMFSRENLAQRLEVELAGEGAECRLEGLYVAGGKQRIENRTRIDHRVPHGTSREFYKGILDGEAEAVFDGLIVVHPDAQKTDSAQTNRNLLLSPAARAHSHPELKIFANDVKCRHGATIGQLDREQLFYLRSRGLGALDARRLLILAFAGEMIDALESEALRQEARRLLAGVLHV